ncbi:MAG: hypothetical protein IIZ06_03630 [Kiritimatiellae bacterium]|nr:hypothetical protein [Kiritimatiellia bacterium]
MAKFRKGDKVESVKTGARGVVDEVYDDEKYAVLFDGATNPDRVEGFQIKAANGCARNAKFKVGDIVEKDVPGDTWTGKVVSVSSGNKGVRAVTIKGDGSEGPTWAFDESEIRLANSAPVRSTNAVVQNAINARRARNAGDLSAPFQAALSAVRKLAEEAKKINPDHEVYKDAVKAGTALLRVKPKW